MGEDRGSVNPQGMSVSFDLRDKSGMDGQMSDSELTEELRASVSFLPKQGKTIPSGWGVQPPLSLLSSGRRVDLALGVLTTGHCASPACFSFCILEKPMLQ